MKNIHVKMPQEMVERIDAVAERFGHVSRSSLIRYAVIAYTARLSGHAFGPAMDEFIHRKTPK